MFLNHCILFSLLQLRIRELMEQQKTIAMQIEQEQSSSDIDKQLIHAQLLQVGGSLCYEYTTHWVDRLLYKVAK